MPGAPVVLDIVSESGALHEGVVAVLIGKCGVRIVQVLQKVERVVERDGVILQKPVLGNVGNCETS